MAVVNITIEVEDGVAIIANVETPPGLTVRIRLRDYDIDGSDPDGLDADEEGRLCFENVMEYPESAELTGFI